jgi:thiamine phosphate synthase YjbQ (UPF0047 family)
LKESAERRLINAIGKVHKDIRTSEREIIKYADKLNHKRVKVDDAKEYKKRVNAAKRHLVQIEKETRLSVVEVKRCFQAIVVGEAEAMQAKRRIFVLSFRLQRNTRIAGCSFWI